MQRRKVLVADHHEDEARILRKALVDAGYEVWCAAEGEQALQLCETVHPQLIYLDARLPLVDGPHLIREIRDRFKSPPVLVVLAAEADDVEERVHYLSLDIDDFLRKPFDLNEFTARVELLFCEAAILQAGCKPHRKGFAGNLAEMNLVDLLQTLEVGKKSGVLRLSADGRQGQVFLREGDVIDAAVDDLQSINALNRLFTWSEGDFFVDIQPVERTPTITEPSRTLRTEGMRRLDQWQTLQRQLPPLRTVVVRNDSVDVSQLEAEHRSLWTLLSGPKRLIDLIYESDLDDLVALRKLVDLYQRGALQPAGMDTPPANGSITAALHHIDPGTPARGGKLRTLFSSLFGKPGQTTSILPGRRQYPEHPHLYDRRTHSFRRDEHAKEKNTVYLSRSELLLIRERLLQE